MSQASHWSYQREEYTRPSPGDYRVEIVDAQEAIAQSSGNQMIVVTVKPNRSNIAIKHYIVRNEYFNRNMTQFFDAFPQIAEGDFAFLGWVGCVGAARLKEDESGYLRVAWFLTPQRAEKLPPWQGEVPERQTVTDLLAVEDDPDFPF